VAVSLARILNVFQTSMVTILFPKIAAKSLGEVILVTGQATRITAVAMSATSLVVAACGPFLLTLLYGPKFQEAEAVLRILILEAVISSTTLVLAQAFMALGRPGIVTMLQAIGVGLSVPLMILLIPHFGLVGAGLALLASAIVRLVCILACFPTILKTAPPNLIITRADWQYFRHKLLHPNV
jgi:O-antigen/teichoic acid export membrane protein